MSLTTGLLEDGGLGSLTIPTRFVDGRTIETRGYGALTEDIEWQFEKDIGHGQYGRVWLEKSPQVVTKRVVKENVFVVQRFPFWWLKLGDFGLSKQVTVEEPSLNTKVGTPAFEAPEVGDPRTTVPIYTPGHGTLNDFIRDEARFPLRGLTEKNVSEDGIDFLRKTIIVNPDERLTAVTALNHPWLRGLSSWDRTLARKIAQMPDPRSINEHDIILVLGPTGVGKSRFIRHFAAGGGPAEGEELTSAH
ncbi:hypothetical protein C8A00DRAFT_28945 [Chaetomidium leptoderma]|uniref:Protein kinase domain-containing protein n=1 Tax=Chaetomidium leptoderma TaxID=669021 RepID=A0AAN7A2K9_9PEZI|nr:hypothetical protein C8A00DRAFT_28945 [Chaetomidium leptoderma]